MAIPTLRTVRLDLNQFRNCFATVPLGLTVSSLPFPIGFSSNCGLDMFLYLCAAFCVVFRLLWGHSLDRYDDGLQKHRMGMLTLFGVDDLVLEL